MNMVTTTKAPPRGKRNPMRTSSFAVGVLMVVLTLATLMGSPPARSDTQAPALDRPQGLSLGLAAGQHAAA